MVAVHQFVPTYAGRSAIGFHTHQVTLLLREMGVRSNTYVGHAAVDDRGVFPYRSFEPVAGESTWLLYQLSIGHAMGDFLALRPEPLVVNYHNITPEAYFQPWEPLVVPELRSGRAQLRRLASRTALAIAVSPYNERELTQVGYPATVTVPFLGDYQGLGAQEHASLSADLARTKASGGTDILFVGRLAPHKAQHQLIKVLALYQRLYDPQARLWLVGGSSSHLYETTLVDFAKGLGVAESVHLTGSVDQSELVSYYRHADVFVSTSEHEGFGVPLIEAMWQSVPVVARACSGVADTVGDAGVLLEPTDAPDNARVAAAIHRVLDDGKLRSELVQRGRARAAHFSLDRGRAAFRTALAPLLEE